MSRNTEEGGGDGYERPLPLGERLKNYVPRGTLYDAANGVTADIYLLQATPGGDDVDEPDDAEGATTVGDSGAAAPKQGIFGSLLSYFRGSGGKGSNLKKKGRGKRGVPSGGPGGPGKKGDDDPLGNVTLDDVGGLDDQVAWLRQSVLSHLTEDSKLEDFGVVPPKGILFYGPPGTGKTLLARAFGNELKKLTGKKVSFFHRRGPDVYTPWFGESSRQLRDVFSKAVRMKPSIIFFDEIDGLCPSRESIIGSGATSVVTTLLGCMDTLPPGEVFVFGASNLVDSIDPAMRRPGRFDKHLEFFPPSLEARKKILEIHTRKWKNSHPSQEKIAEVAERTLGFTGADLEKLTREAVFTALQRTIPSINSLKDEDATGVEEMTITDQDWESAFKRVRPSPAVFDSATYVPKVADARVNPLVQQTQQNILTQLRKQLPSHEEQEDEENQKDTSVHLVNSLVIVYKKATPVDTIGTYILPGVFADKDISLMPVYLLSAQRLHASPLGPLVFLDRTLKTVMNCAKPCILYIPMIDILIREIPGIFLPLAHGLQLLNGNKALVLATSATDTLQLEEHLNFRNLFAGPYRTIYYFTPTPQETREFLQPVFGQARDKASENVLRMKCVDIALEKAISKLNEATIKDHLNLHDELDRIINREEDSGVMIQKIQAHVDDFVSKSKGSDVLNQKSNII